MGELNFRTIGKHIKERRKALGLTQEYIANQLDINASHISNIECGRVNPSLTILVKIANILQCSVDLFIHEEYQFERESRDSLDRQIMTKVEYLDSDTKQKVLKIIDLL